MSFINKNESHVFMYWVVHLKMIGTMGWYLKRVIQEVAQNSHFLGKSISEYPDFSWPIQNPNGTQEECEDTDVCTKGITEWNDLE